MTKKDEDNCPECNDLLVTFALFAFNQEKYIRDAINSALKQEYSPLEIIISDDNSTDATYQIILEVCAGYSGPHRVIARQNNCNVGVLEHVRLVANEAKGEFIIFAAGDDISYPQRTQILVDHFLKGADAVCSNYDLMDSYGDIISENQSPLGSAQDRMPWIRKFSCPIFIYGSTSSYRTSIVKRLPNTQLKVMSEDTPLNTMLQVQSGTAILVEDALVRYRIHQESISNSFIPKFEFLSILKSELDEQKKSKLNADILRYIRDDLIGLQHGETYIDIEYLNKMIDYYEVKYIWMKLTLIDRIRILIICRNATTISWGIKRLFGLAPLAFIKRLLYPIYKSNIRLK